MIRFPVVVRLVAGLIANPIAALLAGLLGGAYAGLRPALAADLPPCPPSPPVEVDSAPLPHLSAALKPGGRLHVLAIGSQPVVTREAGVPARGAAPARPPAAPDQSWFPFRMADALEKRVHGLTVTVSMEGGHGREADEMLPVLRAALHGGATQLVLWQTGTVDAVHGVPPGDFYQTLADGVAAANEAGADVVLVDPQYSRFLEANANLAPYEASMQAAGSLAGAVLFHRYDLMHDWVEAGALDYENAEPAARHDIAARLHACLGEQLARTLLADVAAAAE